MKKVWINHFICALIIYGCNGSGKDNNSAEIIQKIDELKEENQRLREDVAKIKQENEPTENRQFKQPSIPVREKDTDMYSLGKMYEIGNGVKQDYSEALKCYRKSIEQGDIRGMFSLAVMYESGNGVQQDYSEAAKWYRKSVEQGNTMSMNNLGLLYQSGWGVQQDLFEAVKLFRKAAEKDDATGQLHLGLSYLGGYGVQKDTSKAVFWLRKAAEQDELFNSAKKFLETLGY